MSSPRRTRVLLGAVGLAGHAFPVLGLARELRRRGHEVAVETSARWREEVEGFGATFLPATEGIAKPGDESGGGPSLADAVLMLERALAELVPEIVVSDLFTLAPALAAERAGIQRASVIHHPYPLSAPGYPPFPLGMRAPRTVIGSLGWRALDPLLRARFRRSTRELDRVRGELGLPPQRRALGAISEHLALVATFPQLEYPRRWPDHVQVCGPLHFEPAGPVAEPPAGGLPLVVIAASTAQDPQLKLLERCFEALADEPVRLLATTGGASAPRSAPANATVVKWLSVPTALAGASAMITHGGHGTLARGLAAGVPLLVCPAGADQPENAARVAWAGAGLRLSRRRVSPARVRDAVGRLLSEPRFAERAGELAVWEAANPGAATAADLVERAANPIG